MEAKRERNESPNAQMPGSRLAARESTCERNKGRSVRNTEKSDLHILYKKQTTDVTATATPRIWYVY